MTVTLAKMGRRKQNCPQKTGNNAPSAQSNNAPEEESEETSLQEDNTTQESDSMSINSEKEAVPLQEENHRKNSSSSSNSNGMTPAPPSSVSTNNSSSGGAMSTTNSNTSSDPLSLFKNPLFNPALLSLNPSLYAVQLAHLQAAQLLSQASSSSSASSTTDESSTSRKRKMGVDEDTLGGASKRPMSPKESPLDLTKDQAKGTFSPGKLDPFTAAAALSPFFSPFLGGRPDMLLPGAAAAAAAAAEQNNSFIKNNPLERMSEIVKGPNPHPVSTPNHHYSSSNHSSSSSSSSSNKSSGPRHSAWQSQWINRGPENSKDIFKCVWCKDAFSSLQDLTDHMKETKHFGPQIPPPSPPQLSPGIRGAPASKPAPPPPPPSIISSSAPSPVTTSSPKARDILKEQLPMPRKLVRGQDVWLGRGEQQTKDILKCMWCGQSFRSLDLMTKHMQETKHYTKVISQEQLSSWKSGGGSGNESPAPQSSPTPASASSSSAASHQQQQSQSTLNSVLTCKVCEVSFSTLRELGDHMVKSNHYADSKGGSNSNPVVSPPPPTLPPPSKEKRKKSLPVRKLLELERAQQELIISGIKSDEGKITCEKCSEKIPVSLFASHIHLCVGSGGSSDLLRRPPSSSAASSTPPSISPPTTKQAQPEDSESENEKQPKSILGSLEKMVQSNFGASKKKSTPVGGGDANLSILQRLGIDESIPSDFSKPSSNESHHFRPIPNFLVGGGKFGSSSRSDSSECSSPDRSKHSNFPDTKEEERVEGHSLPVGVPPHKNSLPPSPAPSQRSIQDYSHREDEAGTPNSLVESKMEDNSNENSEESGRKKNPLAALQMLCDKTEKPKSSSSPHNHNNNNNNGGHLTPSSSASPSLLPPGTSSLYSDPGAILAFSWACNQAIVNDSLLKCPFCDTPFISKGAYRHHLSKMHFVKDEKGMLGGAYAGVGGGIKGPEKSPSPNETISSSSSLTNATTSAPQTSAINANPSSPSSSSPSAKAENAQSKFQKYSQLAKQLSCSSQP